MQPTIRQIKGFGWRRDHLDGRDHMLAITAQVPLPAVFDLRSSPYMPPIYDQGDLGSCTSQAGSRCVDFERKRQGLEFMTPSRMMIYYNTRVIEGTQDQDAGGELRDVMKTLAAQGTCAESEWAYEDSNLTVKPPAECYTNALKFEATQYSRVTQQEYFLKHSLSILGRPVMFGMSVFEQIQSDEAAATGVITMPSANASPVGGHALCLAGFDDTRRHFTVANSWNSTWGAKGYGFIPYEYILNPNLASDFWVLLAEEQ
jgi:C1A family cysteine protease